jgi:hypothetical protein
MKCLSVAYEDSGLHGWNVDLGDFEEDEFAGLGCWFSVAAEIAGGDSGFEDRVDGVVGIELAA